jgi:mRNA interferase MazF
VAEGRAAGRTALIGVALEREMSGQTAERDADIRRHQGPTDDLDALVTWTTRHIDIADERCARSAWHAGTRPRPVVVLTREAARAAMIRVTVAPITSTFKGLSSEVPVGLANGLEHDSVISLDNVVTIPFSLLGRTVGFLTTDQEASWPEPWSWRTTSTSPPRHLSNSRVGAECGTAIAR